MNSRTVLAALLVAAATSAATAFADAEHVAGGIKFAGYPVNVDGVDLPVNSTVWAESYPTQFLVRPVIRSDYYLYYAEWDSGHGGRRVYPSLDGTFLLMPPPGAGDEATVTIVATANAVWADANVAVDAVQDGTFEHPYRVLQDAVDAMKAKDKSYNMVLAKAGVYDEGGTAKTSTLLANRVSIPSLNTFIVRAVDGPERTFIVGAKDPGATEPGYEGWGVNATRCVYSDGSFACVQGFTLTGGATATHEETQPGLKTGSAACSASTKELQLVDCVISNCCGNAGVVSGLKVSLARCRLYDNRTRAGLVTAADASSCVFSGNELVYSSTIFDYLQGIRLCNCTFAANELVGGALKSDSTAYNSIIVGSARSTAATGANNWISGFAETNNVVAGAFTVAEPRFLDPTGKDYHLSTVSPCLDAIPAPTAENWGATYYQYATSDVEGNYLRVAADGKLTAGAYQSGVKEGYPGYLYVDPVNGDDANSGFKTNSAMRTLKCAFTNANTRSGSIVYAMPGTYSTGTMDADPSSVATLNRVIVPAGVSLVSTGGKAVTFIVGESAPEEMQDKTHGSRGCGTNAVRCVYLERGASICGFTVTNGHTCAYYTNEWKGDQGGGIFAADDTCLVADCDIVGCVAFRGGGISLRGATAANCRLFSDMSLSIAQALYGSGRIVNCLVDRCGNGEAVYDAGGLSATVVNCTFGPSCNNSIRDSKKGHGVDVYNSIFLSKPKMGVNYHRCLFATGCEPPDGATVDEDCATASADDIGYRQESRRFSIGELKKSSCAIGRASAAYYDANSANAWSAAVGDVDLYGRPRKNGNLDLGCTEYWDPPQTGLMVIVQ